MHIQHNICLSNRLNLINGTQDIKNKKTNCDVNERKCSFLMFLYQVWSTKNKIATSLVSGLPEKYCPWFATLFCFDSV